jgi:hypothetical protein
LRKTWGENLIGTVGLGLAFVAAYLACWPVVGHPAGDQRRAAVHDLVTVLLAIVALVVLSALQAYAGRLFRSRIAMQPSQAVSGGIHAGHHAARFKLEG